jgi:hypothetical protein
LISGCTGRPPRRSRQTGDNCLATRGRWRRSACRRVRPPTGGGAGKAVARRLGTTSDAIQALLLDHPAPADPAAGALRRRARYDISREQLRDLHRGQGLSCTEIGKRTGYSRTAIKDLARTYGIPMDT